MRVESSVAPLWYRQPNFQAFFQAYKKPGSRPLFFLGSGLSIGAGMPTWKDLLLELAVKAGNEQVTDRVAEILKSDEPKRFQRAGTLLQHEFFAQGEGAFDLWRRKLDEAFSRERSAAPSRVHDILVNLNWHRIITTNYDCLLEQALERVQKEALVCNPRSPNRSRLESHHAPCIYKIHGDIADPESRIILTEQDYEELYRDGASSIFEQTLGSLLRSATVVLFLGYGHNDPYVHEVIRKSMQWASLQNFFALVPTMEGLESFDNFQNTLANLTESLGVKFISYSPANGHYELLELLEYLQDPERLEVLYSAGQHAKRPTVVMLYCGGTIGSETGDPASEEANALGVTIRKSRFDPQLGRFSKRLQDWYGELYNTSENLQIDIQWEVLPPEFQILSENATPGVWNALVRKLEDIVYKYFYGPNLIANGAQVVDKRLRQIYDQERLQHKAAFNDEDLNEKTFIVDVGGRYILGIVLLHGTDTLAQTASALAFSLHNLPCPVVITGANHPPIDRNWTDLSLHYVSSDAWRNLMLSLHFLETFGHRLTETFVCFGDTVHNGVNLRKTAIDFTPVSKDPGARQHEEPFVFRNQLASRQYMFKLIDGLFCNNYYSESLPYELLVKDASELRDLRHIRWDAVESEPARKPAFQEFSSAVGYLKLSPLCLPIAPDQFLPNQESNEPMSVLLVEGYESGTYPTRPSHDFSRLLAALYAAQIPVVLISSSGIRATQRSYMTLPVDGQQIPVLRLYGVIAETALPLLALVMKKILEGPLEAQWHGATQSDNPVAKRITLLQNAIYGVFRVKNIVSEELRDICNQEDMHERLKKQADLSRDSETTRRREFRKRGALSLASLGAVPEAGPDRMAAFAEGSFVSLSRWDFLLILEEIVRPFDRIGAGPDGFAIISDMGFEFGFSLTSSFSRKRFGALHGSRAQSLEEKRGGMRQAGDGVLQDMVELLRLTRIANVSVGQPLQFSLDESTARKSFYFEVSFEESFDRESGDEKYAAESYSDGEEEFFRLLRQGFPEGSDVEQHYEELGKIYRRQMRKTWTKPTKTLDWFLIGIFKGVACELASLLRFDARAVDRFRRSNNHEKVLRQSVRCRILESYNNYTALRFEYYEPRGEDD